MPNLANLAPQVGFAAAIFTTLMGVVGFFGDSLGVGIYTFIVGLGLMPLEAPILCRCVPAVRPLPPLNQPLGCCSGTLPHPRRFTRQRAGGGLWPRPQYHETHCHVGTAYGFRP